MSSLYKLLLLISILLQCNRRIIGHPVTLTSFDLVVFYSALFISLRAIFLPSVYSSLLSLFPLWFGAPLSYFIFHHSLIRSLTGKGPTLTRWLIACPPKVDAGVGPLNALGADHGKRYTIIPAILCHDAETSTFFCSLVRCVRSHLKRIGYYYHSTQYPWQVGNPPNWPLRGNKSKGEGYTNADAKRRKKYKVRWGYIERGKHAQYNTISKKRGRGFQKLTIWMGNLTSNMEKKPNNRIDAC